MNNQITATNAISSNGHIYPASLRNAPLEQQVQCTQLVSALSDVGHAGNWTNARSPTISPYINGEHPALAPGTPIATFLPDNRYPADTGIMGTPRLDGKTYLGDQSHAAIFVSYVNGSNGQPIGMRILEQSETESARVSTKYFITNTVEDGSRPTMGYAYSEVQN